MADDILSKYTKGAKGEPPEAAGDAQGDSTTETLFEAPVVSGGLVTLPGGIAAMLDLRFRTGNRLALPYSYLGSVEYDPKPLITLGFPRHTVTISGRALSSVYTAISNHTAIAIVEDKSGFDDGGDQPFVESISVESMDQEQEERPG
ncbi:MAG: hypothetical protein AAFQ71_11560 [Planctomycetota bacterium]